MISRGYLCVNTVLCASIVYESLAFVSAGFLGDGIKTLNNIQPDEYRFKLNNQSSIASIGPANMWLTYIYTHKERIKKKIMDPARFRHNINSGKNGDKVNTIREMRNATSKRIKKDKWHKEVEMNNENYEDTIVVGQDSVEQWQEKHDNITDLQHIKNSIERHGRKDSLNDMLLSSIRLNTIIYEDQNQEAHLNEWRGTYENVKLNKTSEEEQLRIIAQNRRKEKLDSQMNLLDSLSEDRGKVGKPEYKIRSVMRNRENYDVNDSEIDTNGHNMKINNVLIENLQLSNKGHKAKSQEKLKVTNSPINNDTLFNPDYLDPAVDIGPIIMWQKNGKKRYENIMFSTELPSSPLGLWKVKEKKRESIDRANDYILHALNNFMNSLNFLSMWSAREKKRKSLRDSRIMGIIDRWDNRQHDIGSIL